MRITITVNGFHGYNTHTVCGTITEEVGGWIGESMGWRIDISEAGADKFRCKMADCKCGEVLPPTFWIANSQRNGNKVEVAGKWPQNTN